MSDAKKALEQHRQLGGKLEVISKARADSMSDLAIWYTPGVGSVSKHLAENPDQTREYTGTNNSIAIVSDGSAVLGLGDIGPQAALPVMEGKALLFKRFANIDGYPVVLDVHSVDEIVATVTAIAPSYGGINLEDIAAPQCFAIEEQLKKVLDIPVMHDDQHGTAVVVLAGLINAFKVTGGQSNKQRKMTIVGAGAAGTAIAKLVTQYNPAIEILMVDSKGIIEKSRTDLTPSKQSFLSFTNPSNKKGTLEDALAGSNVFVGVSKAGLLTKKMVKSMAPNPIIFALANPQPEILPDAAKEAGAAVIATGRSDFPNQVNNALAFPGIFRGALDNKVSAITDEHKIAAAKQIAARVAQPSPDHIIPNVFDEGLVDAIARVIA